MAKKALVILAEGFEEIEAVSPIDILRRSGIEVTVAGLHDVKVKGSRGIVIAADKQLDEAGTDFDALVLPGGMPGAVNLGASEKVKSLIAGMNAQGKVIAAICAAPVKVLAPLGVLKNRSATCYPGMEKEFGKETVFKDLPVVIDGNIITSRGVGTALAFSFALVETLAGKEAAERVKKATVVAYS